MSQSAFHAAAFALAACLPVLAHGAEPLTGTYALPDGQPKVDATLVATPGRGGAETFDIAMTALGQQRPSMRYETELSKQLHVIAVSIDFRTFVHEHADRPAANEHFRVAMRLPRPDRYHVYADAAPSGIGQQACASSWTQAALRRSSLPSRCRRRWRRRTGATQPGSTGSNCAPGRKASSACACCETASLPRM